MKRFSKVPERSHRNTLIAVAGKEECFIRIQTVDVWESKFQSIPLCAVDLPNSTLQSASSLTKDGVHEELLEL
jgi:hypothetical protein